MKLSQSQIGRCPIHEVSAPVSTWKAREDSVTEKTVYCQQARNPFRSYRGFVHSRCRCLPRIARWAADEGKGVGVGRDALSAFP